MPGETDAGHPAVSVVWASLNLSSVFLCLVEMLLHSPNPSGDPRRPLSGLGAAQAHVPCPPLPAPLPRQLPRGPLLHSPEVPGTLRATEASTQAAIGPKGTLGPPGEPRGSTGLSAARRRWKQAAGTWLHGEA